MDDVTWAALTVALTVLGAIYTWWAYRNRGSASALRGLAVTVLPAAAWLTGTLKLLTRITTAITDFATHLVFSPAVWTGVALTGLSAMLFVLSGILRNRAVGGSAAKSLPRTSTPKPVLKDADLDPEIAEITAILKRRGIS